jgi:site-specific DNA recombinase
VTSAAIYARVSSARQKKDQTIGSQTAALRDHAGQLGVDLPEEWVFEDEGHSGATLIRPALERLRDVVAGVGVDVVLVYSPDRLARKFAYQALLIEEFARAGTKVEFIKGPRGDSPEDQLMVQFQGMFAEYEKAQLMERYRRGKAFRARSGSVNVLGGAPFGYRYITKTADSGAGYEIVGHEAVMVAELFRRYADDGASIADLTRWLTSENVPTRTGKARWDRSVVWGMLRNPAYAGSAVFGKTQVLQEPAGLNRRARLEGRSTPRASKTVGRPRGEWIEIPVPAIVSTETFERAARRLADNKRYASRNSKVPSLLQGLAACSACGYGYYRTSTRTTNKKIYYYRCLGSDDYRYQGGRVCGNKPVRADYLDTVVWDHIAHLLADPALIRAEIGKRLEQARTSDPATRQRKRLELELAKAAAAITRMIEAFSEQLITIDELRARMPALRARETNLRGQAAAIDAQLADREAYLKLADDLAGFLAQLRDHTQDASVTERQRVLRLLVKDVLIGPEKITIRHRIPIRERTTSDQEPGNADTEGDHQASCPLRWGREGGALRGSLRCRLPDPVDHHPGLQISPDELENLAVGHLARHPRHQHIELNPVKEPVQIDVGDPLPAVFDIGPRCPHRLVGGPAGTEPEGRPGELRVEDRREHLRDGLLNQTVQAGGHPQQPLAAPGLGDHHPADRRGLVAARVQGLPDLHPVLVQPRAKLIRGHAIHTRRTPVGLHTPQRPAQIARREHPLPHRDLQAREDGILHVRRPAATLRRRTQRIHRLLPQRARIRGMAAINATSTSNADSSVSLDVRSFPADVRSPRRYYDLC